MTSLDLSSLPDIVGDEPIDVDWAEELVAGERTTILRHDGVTLGAAPAVWEGVGMFRDAHERLASRYGKRFRFLLPMPGTEVYLLGDDLSAAATLADLNTRDVSAERVQLVWDYGARPDGVVFRRARCGRDEVWREAIWLQHAVDYFVYEATAARLRRFFGDRLVGVDIAPDADLRVWGAAWPVFAGEGELTFEVVEEADRTLIAHAGEQLFTDTSAAGYRLGHEGARRLLEARYPDHTVVVLERRPARP